MAAFPRQNLLIIAALEAPILGGAAFRMATARPATPVESEHLVWWMVATCLLAGLSVPVQIVMLLPHLKGTEPVPDEARRRALSISLTLLGAAGLLCAAGPRVFDLIFGAG